MRATRLLAATGYLREIDAVARFHNLSLGREMLELISARGWRVRVVIDEWFASDRRDTWIRKLDAACQLFASTEKKRARAKPSE